MHLHASEPDGSVRQCPNITNDQAKGAKRLYEKKRAKPMKMPAAESGCGGGGPSLAKRFITAAVKPVVGILFARFVFMCLLPFFIIEKVWFRTPVHDGLSTTYAFPNRMSLSVLQGWLLPGLDRRCPGARLPHCAGTHDWASENATYHAASRSY